MLRAIREFFSARGVLEVETPLLGSFSVTDPHLRPFETRFCPAGHEAECLPRYLQTSPEFAMKRLLAAGAGSIYQICKSFRNSELGRWHNPEFTLLEWYRVECGLPDLMDEAETLLDSLFHESREFHRSERVSYREVFQQLVGVDPILAGLEDFRECAQKLDYAEARALCGIERSTWLDFLFSQAVQPHLGRECITFVYDFPGCLPSLARSKDGDPSVVERVEVFLDGVELANGFHELGDPVEQEQRLDRDIEVRKAHGAEILSKDPRLLAALRAGLPDCSGIAMGLDRLLMILTDAKDITEVLAFPFELA